MGMCSILSLWVCWDCVWGRLSRGESTIAGRAAFPVFRGCGGLLLLQWFWGCSVYVWNRYRINYIYLFDFNPRIVLSPLSLFNDAVNDTLVFLICMLLYYKVRAKPRAKIRHHISSHHLFLKLGRGSSPSRSDKAWWLRSFSCGLYDSEAHLSTSSTSPDVDSYLASRDHTHDVAYFFYKLSWRYLYKYGEGFPGSCVDSLFFPFR